MSPWAWGSGVTALVAAVVAVILVVGLAGGPSGSSPNQAAPASVLKAVTGVSEAVSSAVGDGGVANTLNPTSGSPAPISGTTPQIVYVGAESCPYCAAERWSLVMALSRFGSFANLHLTESAANDVYPSTHSFTFYQASFSSPYLGFSATELTTNAWDASLGNYTPLQSPTAPVQKLIDTYDPQTSTCPSGGCTPFVDLDNRFVVLGSGVNPQILQGMTWQQIAATLDSPPNTVAKMIIGDANWLTAGICKLTGDQPSSVCQADPIPTLEGRLG